METDQNNATDCLVQSEWPSPWGADPTRSWSYSDASPDLYHHKEAIKARKAKEVDQVVDVWRRASSWERTSDHENNGPIAVLESALYLATKEKSQYIEALLVGFDEGLFPSEPIDAWKERWMREGFVRFLCEAPPDSPQGRLANLVLDRWPWAFAWAGQENVNFRHPLATSVRRGNYAFAEKMMDAIPASAWLDWDVYYDTVGIWKDRQFWAEQDPSWVLKLCEYDPRLKAIDPKTGYGVLETAARDHRPEMVARLLENGLSPDPLQSFGLTLSHWALHKSIEQSWDRDRRQYVEKPAHRVEADALRCGRTLGILANLGFPMDAPALKAPKVPGVRRPAKLPKPPETASGYLERLRVEGKLKDDTVAAIQRGYLEVQPVASVQSAPSARKRL